MTALDLDARATAWLSQLRQLRKAPPASPKKPLPTEPTPLPAIRARKPRQPTKPNTKIDQARTVHYAYGSTTYFDKQGRERYIFGIMKTKRFPASSQVTAICICWLKRSMISWNR